MSEKESVLRKTARRYYKAKTREGRMAIRKSFCDATGNDGRLWELISLDRIDPDSPHPYLNSKGYFKRGKKPEDIHERIVIKDGIKTVFTVYRGKNIHFSVRV